jgi:hypothetical protein
MTCSGAIVRHFFRSDDHDRFFAGARLEVLVRAVERHAARCACRLGPEYGICESSISAIFEGLCRLFSKSRQACCRKYRIDLVFCDACFPEYAKSASSTRSNSDLFQSSPNCVV